MRRKASVPFGLRFYFDKRSRTGWVAQTVTKNARWAKFLGALTPTNGRDPDLALYSTYYGEHKILYIRPSKNSMKTACFECFDVMFFMAELVLHYVPMFPRGGLIFLFDRWPIYC